MYRHVGITLCPLYGGTMRVEGEVFKRRKPDEDQINMNDFGA